MTISRSIHVAANGIILFLFIAKYYSIVYMYHIFFIHSSFDGHLGCFHVLAIVNSASMNIGVHVSFWIMVFSGYMPRSGIAGLTLHLITFLTLVRGKSNPFQVSFWMEAWCVVHPYKFICYSVRPKIKVQYYVLTWHLRKPRGPWMVQSQILLPTLLPLILTFSQTTLLIKGTRHISCLILSRDGVLCLST